MTISYISYTDIGQQPQTGPCLSAHRCSHSQEVSTGRGHIGRVCVPFAMVGGQQVCTHRLLHINAGILVRSCRIPRTRMACSCHMMHTGTHRPACERLNHAQPCAKCAHWHTHAPTHARAHSSTHAHTLNQPRPHARTHTPMHQRTHSHARGAILAFFFF